MTGNNSEERHEGNRQKQRGMEEREKERRRAAETQPAWYAGLKRTPYFGEGLNAQQKKQVLGRVRLERERGNLRRRNPLALAAAVTVAGVLLALVLVRTLEWSPIFTGHDRTIQGGVGGNPERGGTPHENNGNNRKTRNLYTVNNVKVLEVFPGGDYAAGTPAGSWWNFYTPFDQLKDRMIRIEGVNHETGTRITELAEMNVSEAGKAYDDFTRISTRFALPVSGEWSFVVFMDGEPYADVVFDVPDAPWQVSPIFRSGAYDLHGVKGRLGFIDPGFRAGQANKYMWHFWGGKSELEGKLRIVAVRKDSNRVVDVFEGESAGSPLNGADAAAPTMMSLPEPGLWRLMAFIGDRLHGSVVVEVKAAAGGSGAP
ncbi:DUF4871 domain-containing protein [Paenibacillus sp. GYB004]|uniref:DUF4871 domain-containing protein n=1 Tax=Paenibacillus sp. GYB004 TaxID=2994393 RepID=UPI002F96706E